MSQHLPRSVRRLFRLALRRPDHARDEMDAELRFHLESRVEHLVARGMSREAAEEEAWRRFAPDFDAARARLHESAERREHRMKTREWLRDLVTDIGYAARGLSRRPGFTLIAVATLAVGIGATTTIYSAVHALILKPLPFREPDRLMKLSLLLPTTDPGRPADEMVWSYPKFIVFRDAQNQFAELALYQRRAFTIGGGEALRVIGETVGASYLATLGVRPHAGRDFTRAEDAHAGTPRVAIIGYALWQRRFNADPNVVGGTIQIDREPFEIVGVAPAGFKGLTGQAEVFIPFTSVVTAEILSEPYSHTYQLVGRLKPNVTSAEAQQATALLGARIHQAYSLGGGFAAAGSEKREWGARAVPLDATRVSPLVRRSVLILLAAVGFVLLITCANLASLLLGRAATRRYEIGIRLAIGAGRGRLVRMLLAESVLIAVIGGVASMFLAWWGTRLLAGVNPADTLRVQGIAGLGAVGFNSIQLDFAVFFFAGALTLTTVVLFGLAPAIEATAPRIGTALTSGRSPRSSSDVAGVSSRRLLVVAEMALALVLLAGSGLMLRSLANLTNVDPGFDSRNVLTLRLTIPPGSVARDSLPGFYDELLRRVAALPGVNAVALGDCPPVSGGCNGTSIDRLDRPRVAGVQGPSVGVHWTTPEWFSVLRVPLLRGRLYDATDRLGAPKVVLISESAARVAFPGEDPIGKRIAVGQGGFHDGATIAGVVGDVRFGTIDSLPLPDVYISYLQSPRSGMIVYVRTTGDPAAITGAVRGVIGEMAPELPVYDVQPMRARVASAMAQTRFSAVLLAIFSFVALALALIGIYGVMSFAVTQRSREIGIRMALGADRGKIVGMVLREGMVLAIVGAVIGLSGAFALTRILSGLLYGVSPSDPATYLAITTVLVVSALSASWLPARRAAGVDPNSSLRSE